MQANNLHQFTHLLNVKPPPILLRFHLRGRIFMEQLYLFLQILLLKQPISRHKTNDPCQKDASKGYQIIFKGQLG